MKTTMTTKTTNKKAHKPSWQEKYATPEEIQQMLDSSQAGTDGTDGTDVF